MLSALEKEQKRDAKLQRDALKFKANIAIPRPGTSAKPADLPVLKKHGIELSDLIYVRLEDLKDNPLNEYPPLSDAELVELTEDIKEKGILIALILKPDGTIVCGHNRKRAGINAGLERGPAQQILSLLTPELERDIMKSENDRRRGGHWSRERKEKFIQENFGTELGRDGRGGDYGNQHTGGKTSLKFSQPASLAREIEKKSRGRITKGTADRLLADMRKKTRKKPESGTKRLSAKEKRRAEKLAARLETLQNVISVLEKKLVSARAAEKSAIAELKKLR